MQIICIFKKKCKHKCIEKMISDYLVNLLVAVDMMPKCKNNLENQTKKSTFILK